MKIRSILWLTSLALFLASLVLLEPFLPARVAMHFGASGAADGWMPRSAHLFWFGVFGVGISAFEVGLLYAVRFLPARFLNVPHPEYWRAPEHYREACRFLFRDALWVGTGLAWWCIGLNAVIVEANRHSPPNLNGSLTLGLTAVLLLGMVVWIGRLFWYFNHPGKA